MAIDQISKDFADGFDQTRKDTLGPASQIILLRKEGKEEGKPFSIVRVITKNFQPKTNDARGTINFRVADMSSQFGDDVRNSTHLIVRNSKIAALNNVVHELTSDTALADGTRPYARIRAASIRIVYDPFSSNLEQ